MLLLHLDPTGFVIIKAANVKGICGINLATRGEEGGLHLRCSEDGVGGTSYILKHTHLHTHAHTLHTHYTCTHTCTHTTHAHSTHTTHAHSSHTHTTHAHSSHTHTTHAHSSHTHTTMHTAHTHTLQCTQLTHTVHLLVENVLPIDSPEKWQFL